MAEPVSRHPLAVLGEWEGFEVPEITAEAAGLTCSARPHRGCCCGWSRTRDTPRDVVSAARSLRRCKMCAGGGSTICRWASGIPGACARTPGPHAVLVHDPFHIVAKYGLEVIDRVRMDETDRLAKAADPGPVRTARRFRTDWRRRALPSRIPVLRTCTAMRERHHDRIRRHCRFPINSGALEGCDGTIKVR